MANTVKNLKQMMGDSRTRMVIIFTGVLLVIGIAVGFFELRSRVAGPNTQAALRGVPQNIRSIPGGFDTPETVEYKRLQEKQNAAQAQQALREGKSSIPTIVESGKFGSQNGSGDWQTGLGFSSLNRIEEGSQFTPKKVDLQIGGTGAGESSAVYNPEGCLVGYEGKDKKVCDLNGTVIGTVGADGKIKLVNQPSFAQLGKPIYDAKGRLIGYDDGEGSIRNSDGKIIGAMSADGAVRDASGKILGKTGLGGTLSYGKPIYDANGHLIGYAGPDGLIRDASGKVIGTVGADGIARDLNGQIISKVEGVNSGTAGKPAATTGKGTPVYDASGNLIGYAGTNGVVRAANGKIIGSVGPDGTVRDALGIPIAGPGAGGGGVGVSPEVSAEQNAANSGFAPASAQTDALQAIAQRQAEQISAAQADQIKQQLQASMTTQVNQLMSMAWTAPAQQYVEGAKEEGAQGAGGGREGGSGRGGKRGGATGEVMFKAGTILFAVLDTAVNSDEASSPVMATVVSGKLKGSKLMGGLTVQGERVKLSFNLLNIPTASKSIRLDAIAIDPNTARTGLSSYTDNHYLLRYGSLFASSFIEGYGQAVQTSGQQLISNGLQTISSNPDLSPKDKLYVAFGKIGQRWSGAAGRLFNTPPTVHVYAGTAVGVLIMSDLLEQTE